MKKQKHILLVNDDGIEAEGIQVLQSQLLADGWKVTIVASDRQQSAQSHAITLKSPVTVEKRSESCYVIENGKPADCAHFGIERACETKPDLVLSGINHGPNYAYDVFYSGTVAGVAEGIVKGIPGMALSSINFKTEALKQAAQWSSSMADILLSSTLPKDCFLNINFPDNGIVDYDKVEFTKPGMVNYGHAHLEDLEFDETGKVVIESLYGGYGTHVQEAGTDCQACYEGSISVTLLTLSWHHPEHADRAHELVAFPVEEG